MKETGPKIKGWKVLAARILHPVPVFCIVTFLSVLIYAVPNLRHHYGTEASAIPDLASLIFSITLPVATGLIAAIGAHFGLHDLRKKIDDRHEPDITEGASSEEYSSRAIARHLPIAVITLTSDLKVTYINPAASDLLYHQGQDPGSTVSRFIDTNGLRSGLEDVFGGATVSFEKTQTFPDDVYHEQTWKITGVPITRQGEVAEALLLIEDRTQYRMLEDELIRSEDRYRNIFNHAPCGIFFTDSQGHYLDANPSALKMLGYSLEELSTLSTRELSADSDRRLRRLRETPGWIEEKTRYLRKDGKVVEAELLASSYQSGKDTYFIGIAKDVTARNELERSLSAARARLKAVMSLESRPLLLLDSQDRVANVNAAAAELLACPSEKLLGLTLEELIQNELPPIQETSSASPAAFTFNLPDSPPRDLSVIRLSLGNSDSSGSLLILSANQV